MSEGESYLNTFYNTMSNYSPSTGQDGPIVPSLVYGTRIHASPHPQPNVLQALRTGFRAVDTAATRKFHNEEQDGIAIQNALSQPITRRDSLFIQTKYTRPYGHPIEQTTWPYDIKDSHSLRALKSLARSTRDLQVDYIDAYLLHTPLESVVDTLEVWRTLEDVARRGGIHYLGICNVNETTLCDIWEEATKKPTIVQNAFENRNGGYDVGVVRFCRQKGILYQVFGVFWPRNEGLFGCKLVRDLEQQGMTKHQALIRALVHSAKTIGLQLCIVSGTTSESHMEENVAALEVEVDLDHAAVSAFLQVLGWYEI